jgi:23S rRNA-/tRNA-specific pseudouridylate synthase
MSVHIIRPNTSDSDLEDSRRRKCCPKCLEDVKPSVIYHSDSFVVINKPCDVRMDGNFEVTVEKLVSLWTSRPESSLKWVHQLDYSTSGVLCIALNKLAA